MDISISDEPAGLVHINRRTGVPKVWCYDFVSVILGSELILEVAVHMKVFVYDVPQLLISLNPVWPPIRYQCCPSCDYYRLQFSWLLTLCALLIHLLLFLCLGSWCL